MTKNIVVLFFMLLITSAAYAEGLKPAEEITVPTEETFQTLDSFVQYQSYIANMAPYEPVYFLVGTDPKKSTFQLSFKYRLFTPGSELVQTHPWMEGFHIAYTQTSFMFTGTISGDRVSPAFVPDRQICKQ